MNIVKMNSMCPIAPNCASVEKSPSKGPIRRQLSYVLKESKF